MKKYFIHLGTAQEGPFSIEELKERKISADTPVWYDECPSWTRACDIEELKQIFVVVTPDDPLQQKVDATPAPEVQEKEHTAPAGFVSSQPAVKQKSTTPYIITIVFLLLCIAALGAWIYTLKHEIVQHTVIVKPDDNTVPRPVLVSKSADDGKSDLWKKRFTVYAVVRNEGAKGKVLVVFYATQNGTRFVRTQTIDMETKEIKQLEETFTEVRRLKGEVTFDVDARAK